MFVARSDPCRSVSIRKIRGLVLEITQRKMGVTRRMEKKTILTISARTPFPWVTPRYIYYFSTKLSATRRAPRQKRRIFRPLGGSITGCGGRCSENLIVVRPWQIAVANLVAEEAVNGRSLTPNVAVGWVGPCASCLVPRAWCFVLGSDSPHPVGRGRALRPG